MEGGTVIEKMIQSMIIIVFEAICCILFFNIFVQSRKHIKLRFLFISTCFYLVAIGIPAFLMKSILIILIMVIFVKLYYKATILQSMALSASYYGMLIGIDYLLMILIKLLLNEADDALLHNPVIGTIIALLCKIILLTVVIIIRLIWKTEDKLNMISSKEWVCFFGFPIFTIISLAKMLSGYEMMDETIWDIFLLIAFGLVALNFLMFYLIHEIVNREAAVQDSRLMEERTKNQMNFYSNMHDTYERQRMKIHDYKNQLLCMQGMLASGKLKETIEYITNLTGSLIKDMDIVHTNHAVVDAIINQKYRYAQLKEITLIMILNDLSDLTMNEEDLVVLLSNILDNAIEACNKLRTEKIIKLKITTERDQLLISAQNPLAEPVHIIDNRVVTTKANKKEHGIGLLNICSVVEKYNGTYAIQCKKGWFYLSVLIPY